MSRPSARRLPALLHPVNVMLAALLLLVGVIPLAAALLLYQLHSRAERLEAEVNASKVAALLLRGFEQSIDPIDSLLTNFAATYSPSWSPARTFETLKGFSLPSTIVQLSVVDKNGRLVASNLSGPNPDHMDLSDREHIRVHMQRGTGDGDLFISKPVLGRISKIWTLQLTRPLKDELGRFAGVVVASYAISDFIDFYKKLRTDDDMLIALVGKDGVVRARAAQVTSFGDDLSKSEAFSKALSHREGRYEARSPIDGMDRIGYTIQSALYPLIVTVAYSLGSIREQTQDFRTAIWGTAGALSVALLLVFMLGGRYLRLQQRLNAQDMRALAQERESRVLEAISRVPGISVTHVTASGPSTVGAPPEGPLAGLVRTYLRSPRFRALAARLKGPTQQSEHLSDGRNEFEVEVVVTPLEDFGPQDPQADPGPNVVVFTLDQTERRMEENKLYQMSKLASLGEVATGLAHEINQPLGVIRLAAANALTGMKRGLPPEHLQSKLDRILQQTVRMSRIIDHMRIFGRKSDEQVQPCRVDTAVEGAEQVVGAQFRLDDIALANRLPADLPSVLCRQEQLEQVLINLLQNARDAIGSRREAIGPGYAGRISVTAAPERGPDGRRMVRIEVEDNAGGIPEDIVERIFQPFFTTKPPGKGTGLGLSVSFGIIRDHGGSLSVANGPDGAIFTIRLPAHTPVPPAAEPDPLPPPASAG